MLGAESFKRLPVYHDSNARRCKRLATGGHAASI
jgi:hypothetical protein